MKKSARFFLFISTVFVLACNPLKKIPSGSYFLSKNKIDTDTLHFKKEELTSLIKQKTNRKILGIVRLHLGIYNFGNTGDTTVANHNWLSRQWKKVKRGLREIGEEPVLVDTSLTEKSRQQLEIFLQRKGFFNATVSDSVFLKKKKAIVQYKMNPRIPYTVRNVSYSSSDEVISDILKYEKSNSLILSGKIYDENILDKERDRITAIIRDLGYYFFNRNYLTYELDTSLGNHQVDIYLYVSRLFENATPEESAEHPVEDHHSYHFNNIYVFTNYDSHIEEGSLVMDTSILSDYHFISNLKKDYIRNEALVRYIFMKKGDRFLQKDVDYTYARLADLNIFKFINFRFQEVPRDSNQHEYLLNVFIQLSPIAKQEYKIESELTHNGGNLGIAGNLTYQSKNLFRGAESLELKLTGGLEALRNLNDNTVTKSLFFFNTYDFGPDLSLGLKKFLIPGFLERRTSRYFNPKTYITIGTNYQDRPDYKRIIWKFSFGYQWRPSVRQRLQYYPFEVNSVIVDPRGAFQDKLNATKDQSLIYSYGDHLIASSRVAWSLTNQSVRIGKSFFFFRTNFETAGNTLYLYEKIFPNTSKDENGKYTVFKNVFSQYIKPDVDFTYHMRINQINTVVYRIAGGIGFTYGNSDSISLPFDKAFFAGGANDIRAWLARSLGPGSFKDTSQIENGGDIKLVANVEYRVSIFKTIEAAAFVDAGNVWLRKATSGNDPTKEFDTKTFASEIAVGAGLGLRFNFNFFIIRTDFAMKLVDPALDASNRWEYAHKQLVIGQIAANFAIGYPF